MQALPTGEGTPVAPGQLLQPQEPALATESELKTDEVVDGWIQTNNFAYTKSVDWIKETGDKLAQGLRHIIAIAGNTFYPVYKLHALC